MIKIDVSRRMNRLAMIAPIGVFFFTPLAG